MAGRRKSFYAKSAYEASQLAAESLGLTASEDTTLHSFYVSSYWPSKKPCSMNWRSQIAWAYDNYIGDQWGGKDMSNIVRKDVQRWFNSLIGTMENSTLKRIKIVLSNIFNVAIEDELISLNPVTHVRLPMELEPVKTALSMSEINQLLRSAPERMKPTIILLVCGLRVGEACAPSRSALKTRYGIRGIQVEHQVLQPKGGAVRTPVLKTPQSHRFIPLPQAWLDIIETTPRPSDFWLSCNADGGYLLPNNVTRELDAIVKQARIQRVTPHELRHTFISIMENELEAPAPIIAKLAGRKHLGSTAGYSHTHVHQLARWMERFQAEIEASTICTTGNVVQMGDFESEERWCPGKDSNFLPLADTGT